ncbi:hypothetical protein JHK86_008664 [Glycine max]|nr:hypothetical protein JHK86_008664 [Glycine max]
MDAATRFTRSSWMSAITTIRAPCSAKTRAVASPMPLAPPVTMATLAVNLRLLLVGVDVHSAIISDVN